MKILSSLPRTASRVAAKSWSPGERGVSTPRWLNPTGALTRPARLHDVGMEVWQSAFAASLVLEQDVTRAALWRMNPQQQPLAQRRLLDRSLQVGRAADRCPVGPGDQ